MYRVVLYGLIALVIVVFAFSFIGIFTYASIPTLLLMLGILSVASFSINMTFARLFGVYPNLESSMIMTLILFFVLAAPSSTLEWIGIGLASAAATASKYLITWRLAHIFNPAAFGVFVVGLIGVGSGAWWLANPVMILPLAIVGFLILYKLRGFTLFFTFAVPAILLIILQSLPSSSLPASLLDTITLYPIIFLGTIMLTEPHTMPIHRFDRLLFGALVGVLFASTFDFGFISASPEIALLIGNLFAFAVSTRTATELTLVEKNKLTPTTYSYKFKPDKSVIHEAGQYMEFTLPGLVHDTRGNRRSFSIASSPGDELIEIGVKFYKPGSSFKSQLAAMNLGEHISASNVAGEFVLPKNITRPIVLLAGGIGITPFISMLNEYMKSTSSPQIDLYYFVSDSSEIAYKDTLASAKTHGIHVHTRIGRERGLRTTDIEDHTDADFYISGPPGLIDSYQDLLHSAGIPRQRIHTDYFTGY